ncbi:unnamed protein product [Orchesella dallaii]|uniref:Pickpocket protein 28 n=1 Tax=Orchesella dallaii TaxID=48710 RepID=A0ABP1PT59_9HEXA
MSLTQRLKAFGDLYDLNHICEASTTFAQRFNVSNRNVVEQSLLDQVLRLRRQLPGSDPTQILRKTTQNCSELILLCLWLDQEQDCSTFFQGIETDYGYCCTFNVVPLTLLLKYRNDSRDDPQVVKDWHDVNEATGHNVLLPAIEKDKNVPTPKYPYRQVYHGRSSGLSVLLDPDLDEYFCQNTDSDGFVIGTSHPLDFPRVRDHGIAVRPNSETFMSIRPDLTIADSSIFGFSIEKRKCYLAEEYKLRYYSYYTPSNCVDECIANHTFESCHCIQYYMPRFSLLSVLEILYFSTIRVCLRSYARHQNKSSPASAFIAKTSRLFPERNGLPTNYPGSQQSVHLTSPGAATMFGYIPTTGEKFHIIN